ncbi:hypothetical protein ACFT7S_38375 [Streptomyces sp. NPDC057136]|uniref:hypothetical protein n=1 Tax=Streptomyces sp. NPDC057136 TaxID=3346029 RepID=UPI00363362B6
MQGRIWIDWRLVCLAAMVAVGAPGQAVVEEIGPPARLVLAVIGLFAWWYLFRCLADGWGSRLLRRDGREPSLAPWLVFVLCFYAHGLLLGHVWRDCGVGEPGSTLLHVLVSSTVMGLAGVAAWIRLSGPPDAQRVLVPAVGVLALAVLLLWPAMAVWHLLAGSTGQACAPGDVPAWWPALLPIG